MDQKVRTYIDKVTVKSTYHNVSLSRHINSFWKEWIWES